MKKLFFLSLITFISISTFAGTYGSITASLSPNGTQSDDSDYESESYDMIVGYNDIEVKAYANLTFAGQGDLYAKARISWSSISGSGSKQVIAEANSGDTYDYVSDQATAYCADQEGSGAYAQAWAEYWDYPQGRVWAQCRFNDD